MTHWNQGGTNGSPQAETLQQRLARLQQAMRALEEEMTDLARQATAPGEGEVSDGEPLSPDAPAEMVDGNPAKTGMEGPANSGPGQFALDKPVKAGAPGISTEPPAHPAEPGPAVPSPENVLQQQKQAEREADDDIRAAGLSPADRVALLLGRISQPENLISVTERRLALDALGMLLARVPEPLQKQVVDRLCVMERPPRPLLEAALVTLSDEQVARLLAEAQMSDAFLADIVRTGNPMAQEYILRRRHLGPATCMALTETAPVELLSKLLHHEDAPLSEGAWRVLLLRAMQEAALRPALVRHAALPLPVAHELFWHLASDMRAALLARSAGESRQLEELLELARAPGRLPARDFLEKMEMAFGAILQRDLEGAVVTVASATGMRLQTIRRIFRDEGGEAMAVLFKGHHVPGRTFLQTLRDHAQGHLGRRWLWLHEHDRLMDFYGGLGIARARAMLLYWDWRSRNHGPYATYPPLAE